MKVLLLASLGVWALTGVPVTAQSVPLAEHISLAEIRPGMTGYGLTVFSGSVVDTFGVTVIGVQENIRVAGSLLLVEVSGHDLETSSIAQGMSGSPIYLDGRFAGALAFGWGGSLRPIAGVTPAAEMLALPMTAPSLASREASATGPGLTGLLAFPAEPSRLAAEIWGGSAAVAPDPAPRALTADWPAAPRMWLDLAGQLAQLMPELDAGPDQWLFQPLGLAQAGPVADATVSAVGGRERLVPGAACAVPLVTGDAALGAIGTVTWVRGDQVLMMGHPFMQRGPVNLPLATAEVLAVMPSREMSFKMGSIGEIVGTVHHDLRAGLSGRLGPAPAMIPVKVSVRDADLTVHEFNFAVVDDPQLTSTLVFWSIYNALLANGDDASRQTIRYEVASTWSAPAALKDSPLVVSGLAAGPGGAGGLAVEVMTPLNILLNNEFAEARLTGVQATLTRSASLQTASIVGLTSPRAVVRPGEEIVFVAAVEPRLGERESVSIPVTIPRHLPAGPYRVVVASAADLFVLEAQRAAARFQPVDLAGTLAILRSARASDTLVLALFAPGEATVLPGRELANLPQSVARTVRAGNMQAQRSLADYVWRTDLPSQWALSGHAVRSLRVLPAESPVADERRP